ncbi:MAG: guanylate kinase [Candidatus Saccharibacteria bacterium]|nr:guanylate kinase [Candidatus Saccharibacteria bacterium]
MDNQVQQKLQSYIPSDAAVKLIKATPILLLVGPTGAGKDSLKEKLLETNQYHHLISHTTRPPRVNQGVSEQDGREYHFITMAQAEQMLDEQAFVEAKMYSGHLYGTSVAEIQTAHDDHKIALTDVDVQGVAEYKELDPAVMALFLLPPDFETWQARLSRRYGDVVDAADSRLRLETALSELDQLLTTDHYIPVINDNIDQVFSEVQQLTKTRQAQPELVEAAHRVAQKLADDIRTYLSAS